MGELVKQDYFTEMDRRDQEQMIMLESGEIPKELFYDIQGKKGLSYEGINTVAFFMGDVETEKWFQREKVELHGQIFWSTTVRAVNNTFKLAALGTAEVPEMMEVHDVDDKRQWMKNPDGSWKTHPEFDRFCLRKSMSMAQRNAKHAVMPTVMLVKFLEYFVQRAAGKDVEPPYNSRKIQAGYRILQEEGKGGKTEKKPQETRKELKPPTKDVIEYNLKALDPNYLEVIEVIEYQTEFMIAAKPGIALPDQDQYKIDGALQPMGAMWTDNRFWKIPKVIR